MTIINHFSECYGVGRSPPQRFLCHFFMAFRGVNILLEMSDFDYQVVQILTLFYSVPMLLMIEASPSLTHLEELVLMGSNHLNSSSSLISGRILS